MENTLVSVGLKAAAKAGIFSNISPVRANSVNGYLFVTFRGNLGTANVYLAANRTSDSYSEGDVLTASDVQSLRLAITVNGEKQNRLKLFLPGESNGTNMEDIFDDLVTPDQKAVLRMLATEMTKKEDLDKESEEEKTPQRAPQRTA
jgi:hypothetical protein